ncbi:MAG: cysteine--tRNA ligase, partial [Herpetosiphonaceae bacterium]|nr:cysteine--tRNA ligase [Herpetosiphonaceae bacterium]
MHIFNTYSRQKEQVEPLQPGLVRIYSCGPTVYRYIHIGNLRTFAMADWLRRALINEGFEVRHIKNITDVGHMRQERLDQGEDKLVAQARKEGRSSVEIAAFYTAAFLSDERKLNILPADVFPRATQHIPEMIAMIQALQGCGLAYVVGGNVYYDVKQFGPYGALSGNQFEGMLAGEHANPDGAKHNGEDFPLWKAAEPGREMAWDSPWGRGFPGWHIECSAMATHYLGDEFEIHTGGVDNIFPHHENEIAQSEGVTGHPWARYWVHAQHLLTDGLKMAKSTGNDYTLDDILARGFEPLALRYLFATTHYRSRLNFTFTALRAAQVALRRLRGIAQQRASSVSVPPGASRMEVWRSAFATAMADDLNVPRALAVVWRMVWSPAATIGYAEQHALLTEWDAVLGLDLYATETNPQAEPAPELAARLTQRTRARADRQYVEADAIRSEIRASGYDVQDTVDGTKLRRQLRGSTLSLITRSDAGPNRIHEPDRYRWSINLIARNSRSDLQRCLSSIARYAGDQKLQVVIIDNGSTDDTVDVLQSLAQVGHMVTPFGGVLPVEVLFADHNLGYAGGRNATIRASSGHFVVLLDTSMELVDPIWEALATVLDDPAVGVAGPYGLRTSDLREFSEANEPDVDAVEGYLLAFRRANLQDVGLIDEKFRFYRLADIYWSFFFKAAGLRAVAIPTLDKALTKHPHREWYSLTEEEQRTKSKKNYDLFRDRWHHGESLLIDNAAHTVHWSDHDDPRHLAATHTHT